MKRNFLVIFLTSEILGVVLLKMNMIHLSCFFKMVFHFPCPGCGLTRAFVELLNFNFIKAIYYNILVIPITLFLIIINILIVFDIVNYKNCVLRFLKLLISKWYVLFILLVVTEILNIYHNI